VKIKGGIASKNEAVVDSQGRLAVDISGLSVAGSGLQEFISIAHNDAAEDLTITAVNQNYQWTGVGFASTPALMTLNASDELVVVTGGVYLMQWTVLARHSAGTVFPFWVTTTIAPSSSIQVVDKPCSL
jgi:hypothetical protein